MIRHHPEASLLTAFAAGTLAAGPALVVATHVERCGRCRHDVRELEALGGVLLERIEPMPLGADALAKTLARLDASEADRESVADPDLDRMRASLPPGLDWPRSLRGCSASAWRRLSVGVRWCRVALPHDRSANVFLVRVASGRGLPVHGHRGGELTQVLLGSFADGPARFAAGDLEQADQRDHHRPIVDSEGECICLTAVDGRMRFDGPLARAMGSLLRI